MLRTLVVCGASLVSLGCGGQSVSDGGTSDGGSAPARSGGRAGAGGQGGTSLLCPEQCSSPSQFVCDDLPTRTNCRCDVERPRNADACETVWDFSCQAAALSPGCTPYISLGPTFSCECLQDRPRPEDCEHTAQFTCTTYGPVAQGCQCDPSAPTKPEDCPAGMQYRCHSSDPDVGCRCDEIVLIK